MTHRHLTPEEIKKLQLTDITTENCYLIELDSTIPKTDGPIYNTNETIILLCSNENIYGIITLRSNRGFYIREITNIDTPEDDILCLLFPFMDDDDLEHSEEITLEVRNYCIENKLITKN